MTRLPGAAHNRQALRSPDGILATAAKGEESAKTAASGVKFGKYILTRRLATGGMAEVYLATQTGMSGFVKPVAIKRILPGLSAEEHFVTMFLSEARIAAQLTHPNIVQIFDLGRIGGSYYIAMEYVDGVDVEAISRALAERHERFPLEHVARIAATVCDALFYAHRQTDVAGKPLNVVHRDVTPGNVMVSSQGAVKLVDFGIAKASAQLERTRAGTLKGKYAYLSPEQVQNLEVDHRADLFSLGVMLYELTTGDRPFGGSTADQILDAIRGRHPPSPHEVQPAVPRRLSDAIMKALEKDRAKRYRNARELQLDLEGFLGSYGRPSGTVELSAFVRDLIPPREGERERSPFPRGMVTDETTRREQAPKPPSEDAGFEGAHELEEFAVAATVRRAVSQEDFEATRPRAATPSSPDEGVTAFTDERSFPNEEPTPLASDGGRPLKSPQPPRATAPDAEPSQSTVATAPGFRPPSWLIAAGAVVLVVLGIALVWSLRGRTPAPDPAARQEGPTSNPSHLERSETATAAPPEPAPPAPTQRRSTREQRKSGAKAGQAARAKANSTGR